MSNSYFCSNIRYLTVSLTQQNDESSAELTRDNSDEKLLLSQLRESYDSLKANADQPVMDCNTMSSLFPLLNHTKTEIRTVAYHTLLYLADQMDCDELAEAMMDQLICLSWDNSIEEAARLSAAFTELFGRGLEKMTRARDWMLFIPFLSNYYIKSIHYIESLLVENATLESPLSTTSDQAVLLFTHNLLDFLEFVYGKTVSKEMTDFPFSSHDIGSENGDVRRHYLVFSLLSLLYEKVVAHLNLQLSKTYFETHHACYNVSKSMTQTSSSPTHSPSGFVIDIINRCRKLASSTSFQFEKLQQLQKNFRNLMSLNLSEKDIAITNERQMINSRLYPISTKGVAIYMSLCLYDWAILKKEDVLFYSKKSEVYSIAKNHIGVLLDLTLSPAKHVQATDKGIFVMLYFADNMEATVTMDDIEKEIQGPLGYQSEFPVSQIVQVLSSVASMCPDKSIRFYAYKLIESFLHFCTDETRFFFLTELIEHCPFPSMNTAGINLLKDQVSHSFKHAKTFSMFSSPLLLSRFFPLIFEFKQDYKTNSEAFWDDMNHIMQILNFYYFLLQLDRSLNVTTVWNKDQRDWVNDKYLMPLTSLLDNLKSSCDTSIQEMQINTIVYTIEKIKQIM